MRASRLLTGLALAGLISSIGCFDRDLKDIQPVTSTGVTIRVEQVGVVQVDIVVLVDNSGSMAQEQSALTLRFPELINELVNPAADPVTGRPLHPPVEDLNIGVIDSDMGTAGYRVSTCLVNPDVGDNGCFRNTGNVLMGGCSASYPTFLSRNPSNAATYTPDIMANDFACIATLGTSGCGFEQQFKAMRQATTVNTVMGGCNAGFLRPTSLLALIWVSDEEDCSVSADHLEMFDPDRTDLGHLNLRCFLHPDYVESVDDYLAAFRALRSADDQNKIVLGMIVGVPTDAPACMGSGDTLEGCLGVPAMVEQVDPAFPTQLIPSCSSTMGVAFPPRRYVQLAQAFGSNAIVDSICKTDWRDAIKGITDKLVERLPSTCFPRDLTFDTASCLADCKVIETLPDDRACELDTSCTNCPTMTVDDVHLLSACAEGGGGMACTDAGGACCEPLKRDLGTIEMSDGSFRRVCLIRQATRTPAGGTCGLPPTNEGWYYLSRAESEEGCPQVMFGRLGTSGSLIGDGASAELRCMSQLCAADKQCGPTSLAPGTDPTIPCCTGFEDVNGNGVEDYGEDYVCDSPAPRGSPGTCVVRGG
jgi:hypothetical protein